MQGANILSIQKFDKGTPFYAFSLREAFLVLHFLFFATDNLSICTSLSGCWGDPKGAKFLLFEGRSLKPRPDFNHTVGFDKKHYKTLYNTANTVNLSKLDDKQTPFFDLQTEQINKRLLIPSLRTRFFILALQIFERGSFVA